MRRRIEDMEKDKDPAFAREPWQRLLQDRADSPSATTDARIRAAARRALAPRAARWWLPASLAASVLLAVLIVQWQYGESEAPAIVTESDLAAPAKPLGSGEQDAPADAQNAQSARQAQPPRVKLDAAEEEFAPEPDADGSEDRITATGARIGGPERDLETASEVPAEEATDDAPPPLMDLPTQEAPVPAATERAEVTRETESAAEARQGTALGAAFTETATKVRKPEDWYAEIEKLRAAGRIEEADRELERLKAAHPAWFAKHREELEGG